MAVDSLLRRDDLGSPVDLTIQRILVSDEVATTKSHSGAPVEDWPAAGAGRGRPPRRRMGLDRELAIRFLRSQTYAGKAIQSGLLAQWQGIQNRRPPSRQSSRRSVNRLTNSPI